MEMSTCPTILDGIAIEVHAEDTLMNPEPTTTEIAPGTACTAHAAAVKTVRRRPTERMHCATRHLVRLCLQLRRAKKVPVQSAIHSEESVTATLNLTLTQR